MGEDQAGAQKSADLLLAAERFCAARGLRLTRLRRRVLEILVERGEPVKAYDLLEDMRACGRPITAATAYRTLEFLLEQGFAHRVNALNAYVACTGEHAAERLFLLVCSVCRKTEEINDPEIYRSLLGRLTELGFPLAGGSVEVQGICPCCSRA
ncbi:MAG: transcriptional repressor [Deltaproteobacteria bacterium]|jgi:Fur family zinc uptake transcriptional regulator|nr:transcriptional repressor [Deltaproteobacteria bacterium]